MYTKQDLKIGALLRIAHQESSKIVHQRLIEAGYCDVNMTYAPVIQPLGFNPSGLTISDLAKLAGMTTQSMGELVQHLIRGGYVEKERSHHDRRTRIVKLTAKGEELSLFFYSVMADIEREWAMKVGHERFQELRNILVELIPSPIISES
ncbi:MarR family winged helix-turn-helix transcriptional regulator [Alicyclobacillus dauci]|uniref:Winged helix DNA-binding protein n=1 Tax=Alicyclobacillus dauci TaxID=1475485 RepID=A0ABY6Z0N6_9BACL|nr:MarR family transcriptional regulator [Alicyclobacillus dauci]WAH36376.1 winged helix DNA-binding protein [Alicyclobacillus dauci]